MEDYVASEWVYFEPIVFLLNQLKPTFNLAELENNFPLGHYLSIKSMELAYMDLSYKRFNEIANSLFKLQKLKKLRISFFDHKMTNEELTDILLEKIGKLVKLEELEFSFSNSEPFVTNHFEKLGLVFKDLDEIKRLDLFFEGEGFCFSEENIKLLLNHISKNLGRISFNFISPNNNIQMNTFKPLANYLNIAKVKHFSIFLSNNSNEFIASMANNFHGNENLRSFTLKHEDFLDLSSTPYIEPFLCLLRNIRELTLSLKLPISRNNSVEVQQFLNVFSKGVSALNLEKLNLKLNSAILISFFCLNIKSKRSLNSIKLTRKPKVATENFTFDEEIIKNLLNFKNELMSFKLKGFQYGLMRQSMILQFKHLTKFKIDREGFQPLQNSLKKRERLLIIAYNLRKTLLKKKGIFQRELVLEEILLHFLF